MKAPDNLAKPCYVVLGKRPTDNAYQAVIERSFSMDVSGEACNLFAATKYGDGLEVAEHYRAMFSKGGVEFVIFDVEAEGLPIEIDWAAWAKACAPSDKTLSGVVSKFGARNPPFKMKE